MAFQPPSAPPPPPPPPPRPSSLSMSAAGGTAWPQWLAEQFRSSWLLAAGAAGVAVTGLTATGLAIWWSRRTAQRRRNNNGGRTGTRRRRRRDAAAADERADAAAPPSPASASAASASAAVSSSPRRRTHVSRANASPAVRPLSPGALHIPPSDAAVIVASPPFQSRRAARPPSPLMQTADDDADAETLNWTNCEPNRQGQATSSGATSSSVTSDPAHSPPAISFSSCLTPAPGRAIHASSSSSSASSSSSSSTAVIVRASTPARQRILFDFGEAGELTSNRHAMRVLGAVLLVVTLLLLLDPTWLAPISPVLLYSMFTVAQERSTIDDSDEAEAGTAATSASAISARRLDAPPTQAISLFGYSMRVPPPTSGRSLVGQPNLPAAHPVSAHGAAQPPLAAASSSSAPSLGQLRLPSPLLSASSHSPFSVPFPSLTASPLTGPVRSAAGLLQQGSSGLVLQQPRPLRALSDPSTVLADEFVEEEEEIAAAATHRDVEVSSRDHEAGQRNLKATAQQQEEHKESADDRPLRADMGPTIAASLAHSFTTRKIDVNAALSRLSPQHAPAASSSSSSSSSKRRPAQDEHSAGELLSAGESAGSASASASDVESTSEAERAFFSGQSRRDALDALPLSAAAASSVRIHFSFQASFEDVMEAFWRLGSEQAPADSDDTEQSSDSNTPPYTPTKLTPSASLNHLVQQASAHAHAHAGVTGSLTSPATMSSSHTSSAPLFTRAEYVADVISDSNDMAAASSSSSSSSSAAPVRYVIRRVHSPLHLPHLLRKLLGNVTRLSVEERIQVDMSRRAVRLHLHSRVLDGFLHFSSVQSITPHPLNPAHTRWTCDIKLHVYSSCGLMRQQVMSWLSATTKQRQQQISMMLSAAVKRNIKKRARLAYLQEQRGAQANEQDQHEHVELSVMTPVLTQRRRVDMGSSSSSSSSRAPSSSLFQPTPSASHSSRRA